MRPYRYVKAPTEISFSLPQVRSKRSLTGIFTKLLIGSGLILIASVFWPIASYELFTAPSLKKQEFLNPAPALGQEGGKPDADENKGETDLTRPQNWFPTAKIPEKRQSRITHYNLSIPKFNIKDAVVEIGGEDLSKSLIHYPGSALPGEIGATIIFGHSMLPQFFDPTNYLAIFSLLPTLEFGDDIFLKFDGITYTYRVIDKVEVNPDNISVLDQPYDNEYLRLITCTPPGTYLRRGVITAALID